MKSLRQSRNVPSRTRIVTSSICSSQKISRRILKASKCNKKKKSLSFLYQQQQRQQRSNVNKCYDGDDEDDEGDDITINPNNQEDEDADPEYERMVDLQAHDSLALLYQIHDFRSEDSSISRIYI
jgi:hypothetical protein